MRRPGYSTDPDYTNHKHSTENLDSWLYQLKLEHQAFKTNVEAKLNNALTRITSLETENKDLRSQILAQGKRPHTASNSQSSVQPSSPPSNQLPKSFASLFKAKPTTSETLLISRVAQEQRALQNKANNIVIRGAKEQSDQDSELKSITSILKAIDLTEEETSDLQHYRRKHRQTGKPPHIIVTFKSLTSQQKAVKNAKKLRERPTFNGIYINKDLTECELRFDKLLRTERDRRNKQLPSSENVNGTERKYGLTAGKSPVKFYYGIRSGNIFRIDFNSHQPLGKPIELQDQQSATTPEQETTTTVIENADPTTIQHPQPTNQDADTMHTNQPTN